LAELLQHRIIFARMPGYLNLLRRLLGSTWLEWPLKRSVFYRWYLQWKAPNYLVRVTQETAFYRRLLADLENPIIFDVGANRGEKTQIFLELGASVTCIDPEPSCALLLTRRFASYGHRVNVVCAALAGEEGDATMFVHQSGSGYNTLDAHWASKVAREACRAPQPIKVPTRTLDGLFRKFGRPDYIKIDVEGYEAKVLSGLHQPIPLITFEVNLPDFKQQGLACIRRLAIIDPTARFNYFVSCADGEVFPESLPAEAFTEQFTRLSDPSVEVVCRMHA
jgi:FkbM family methyltransferase